MTRYFVGEQPILVGKFANGDTVTVDIWELPSTQKIDNGSCTQISTTGYFYYTYSSGLPTTFKQFVWIMSNAGGQEVAGSFDFDGYHTADDLLKRDMSALSGESDRSPLNALRQLRNKVAIVDTTMSVYKENDSSVAWTATVTQSAGNPITSIDPV